MLPAQAAARGSSPPADAVLGEPDLSSVGCNQGLEQPSASTLCQPAQPALARDEASARGLSNLRFEEADVYSLPFPDGSFDAVFSHGLMGHLGEPPRAFAEQRRVLRAEGVLAVSDNDTQTLSFSPPGSAIERAMGLGVQMMAHRGGNHLLARHFRLALLQAGFGWAEGYAGAEVYARPGETRWGRSATVTL